MRAAHGRGPAAHGRVPGWQGSLAVARNRVPDPAPDSAGGPAAAEDPVEAARQICLRLLTAAPRTRAQLADALRRRQVPDEAAEAVLGRFTEAGLIDDAAFAQAWVESRHRGRGLARRALAAELRRRGVGTDDVRSAVGSLSSDDEFATARRLAERRAASSRGRPLPARVRQLTGMLARKGYPVGMAYQVVREVLAQEQPGEAPADLDEAAEAATLDDWASG